MDDETVALVGALRPMVKTHLRQTRTLLAYLTELDKRLDAYSQEAERRNDKVPQYAHVG